MFAEPRAGEGRSCVFACVAGVEARLRGKSIDVGAFKRTGRVHYLLDGLNGTPWCLRAERKRRSPIEFMARLRMLLAHGGLPSSRERFIFRTAVKGADGKTAKRGKWIF